MMKDEDSYYLAQFDCIQKNGPSRLEVLSATDFNWVCDSCGARRWRFLLP